MEKNIQFKPDSSEVEDVEYYRLSGNTYVKVFQRYSKVRVDIRKYYLNTKGFLCPETKGIQLSLKSWKRLQKLRKDINSSIEKITGFALKLIEIYVY